MISKIVTARKEEYVTGSFVFGKGPEVTVTKISPAFTNDPDETCYIVGLSDGTWIQVKDVVESWMENDS